MTLASEVVMYWNGTAVAQTVGNVTRRPADKPGRINPVDLPPPVTPGWQGAYIATADAPFPQSGTGMFRVEGQTSTTSTEPLVLRDLRDDWSLLGARYNPLDGEVMFRVDSVANGGGAVSRQIRARVLSLPTAALVDKVPGEEGGIYIAPAPTAMRYWYPVKFATYGLWRNVTASSVTISATGSGVTGAVVNSGIRRVPTQVEFANKSGTVSSLTLSATGEDTVTFTSPTNGQIADFGYTTPGDFSATTATVNVGAFMTAKAGSTTWTATTAGGGTIDVIIRWYPQFGSW